MYEIHLYKISQFFTVVFVLYMNWFKYVYGDNSLILYGTVMISGLCMIVDSILMRDDLLDLCPYGVLVNFVMCAYSIMIGGWSAVSYGPLVSALKTYVAFSIVCMVVCYVSKKDGDIEWLVSTMIAVGTLTSISIILNGSYFEGYGYVLGRGQNPNSLGLDMVICLFCLAYKTWKHIKRSGIYFVLALLFMYTIIGCGSRKCLIAGGAICIIWIISMLQQIWNSNTGNYRIWMTVIILFFIIIVGYYFKNEYVNSYSYQRMQTLGESTEVSSYKRVLFYKYALEYFQQRPLFGIGFRQFEVWNPFHCYAHSTYAEAIANWGIAGCIVYFAPAIVAGMELLFSLFTIDNTSLTLVVISLWFGEIFLGVGQIWFYSVSHMIAWTFIYFIIENHLKGYGFTRRKMKYVKT